MTTINMYIKRDDNFDGMAGGYVNSPDGCAYVDHSRVTAVGSVEHTGDVGATVREFAEFLDTVTQDWHIDGADVVSPSMPGIRAEFWDGGYRLNASQYAGYLPTAEVPDYDDVEEDAGVALGATTKVASDLAEVVKDAVEATIEAIVANPPTTEEGLRARFEEGGLL